MQIDKSCADPDQSLLLDEGRSNRRSALKVASSDMLWKVTLGVILGALFSSHVRLTLDNVDIGAGFVTVLMAAAYFGGNAWERRHGSSVRFNFESAKVWAVLAGIVTAVSLIATAIVTWG